ncbi:type VI secretion system baseplate subunit TssG [Yersinia intermedia]|uniref:type VI secretion system baseplate subunit TssG n=1 Tax=Yersinia intermedia TaxID=631 RepID=UPI001F52E350|nr:type VI secretion system baseplate subunit TssG [Yersinia intermedia]UNK24757.1 type VI secretion system baseplate subunit TssG [Yersinia intermedia]
MNESSVKIPFNINTKCRILPNFWQMLAAKPEHHGLFHLLRYIDARSGQPYLLGRAPLPRYEILRLGQKPQLFFIPTTLAEISPRSDTQLYEVSIFNFGLFGPDGPLPLHLTEFVHERIQHYQDDTFLAFTNLFHHRLITLFYRAWADTQPTVSLDRPDNTRFDNYFSNLIGTGQPALQERDSINVHAKYFMAGHLIRHSRDPEGLGKILRHYFKVPVHIVENVPHWLSVEKCERARLQAGRNTARLGESAFLGVAVRDIQHKFRIELGPMSQQDYDHFLPGSAYCEKLRDWVRQYIGIEFVWELRLILAKEALQGTQVGGTQRLGLSSWLNHAQPKHDVSDLTYSPESSEAWD